MGTPTYKALEGDVTTAQIQDWIVKLVRDLNFDLTNIDTQNVNRLDAKVIIANTITANKLSVSQLSAIAADLGTITAGIIYGAYIATANGTYPRIEFSSSGNLLSAFFDSTHVVEIVPNFSGTPALKLTAAALSGKLSIGGSVSLTASGIALDLGSTTDVYISANNFVHLVQGWSSFKNDVTGRTLQTDLDAKANKGLVGTKIYYVSDTSGGVANRKLTFTDGILTAEV